MSIRLKNIQTKIVATKEIYNSLEIDCDRTEIEQLLINLFNNSIYALKHKSKNKGEIQITISTIEEKIKIDFKDNGLGIADKDIPFIFDLFYTTKKEGTGFGLPICKRIVTEHHKGEISVNSLNGEYTVFNIVLNKKLK
jgi:signal transduction histidine kinase